MGSDPVGKDDAWTANMPEWHGLKVTNCCRGVDDKGYGFLRLQFEGGVWIEAYEAGQAGELGIRTCAGAEYWPQNEG